MAASPETEARALENVQGGIVHVYINVNTSLPGPLDPALTGIALPCCGNQAICLPRCVNVFTAQGHSIDLSSLHGDRKNGQAGMGFRMDLGFGI